MIHKTWLELSETPEMHSFLKENHLTSLYKACGKMRKIKVGAELCQPQRNLIMFDYIQGLFFNYRLKQCYFFVQKDPI